MKAHSGIQMVLVLSAAISALAQTRPATNNAAPPALPAPPHFPAVSYFDTNCSRCHGQGGAMMTPKQTTLPADRTRERVAAMARGPAMAPLDNDAQIAAVANYVSSLGAGVPFAVVTSLGDDTLEGEAATGTSVIVEVNGRRVPAKADGLKWKATWVKGWTRILAVKDNAETVIAEAPK